MRSRRVTGIILLALSGMVACGSASHSDDAGTAVDAEPAVDASGDAGAVDASFGDAGRGDAGGPPIALTFAGAYVARDCAPDDGLAYTFELYRAPAPECSADPSGGSVRFYIFEGTDTFFPLAVGTEVRSMMSGAGFGNGSATYCPGGGAPCEVADSFRLRFESFRELVGAAVRYDFVMPSGASFIGSFEADWCEGFGPPMCG